MAAKEHIYLKNEKGECSEYRKKKKEEKHTTRKATTLNLLKGPLKSHKQTRTHPRQ